MLPDADSDATLSTWRKLAAWVLALWIACVFLWYLQFKFTAHPGSVDLFTLLTDWLGFHGHEKAMRIGTGSAELLATILLFAARTQVLGAALALLIMTGAIFFHLVSPLGIDPYGDGGVLFKQACATWAAAASILWLRCTDVFAMIALLHRRLLPAV
ncbi:MAG: DoxX family protein [Alphaproteobacteria bacterium]|nr:DoxX family protein [Alphaproteobacteria bacterium]